MERRGPDPHAELVRVVHAARRRWRLRLALRALAAVAALGLVALLVTTLALHRLSFSPAAVTTARVLLALAAAAVLLPLLRPLARPVSDEQVALYLEEHEPSLRASLVSALGAGAPAGASPALARRTVETALERCRAVEYGRRVERPHLRRAGGMLGALALAWVLVLLTAPAFVRSGARALVLPPAPAAAAPVLRVSVEPGDTSIPRGADLSVSAALSGFRSDRVELLVRTRGDSAVQRIAMLRRPDGGHEVRLFDVDRPAEYMVDAGAARSPWFRVAVTEVPYVDRLQLELHFPAYTGLPPRRVEDGGDVAAPAGTEVRVRATPTRRVPGGRLVLSDGRAVRLAPDSSGALRGEFRVERDGLYHVELHPGGGAPVSGSPQYLVEVLRDGPPTISLSRPGRDTRVTSVEEVFVEARAEDDFGVRAVELVYSVNGAAEQTVKLLDGRPLREVTAGHTLYLEELGLRPGDFVSYYARASDVGPGVRPAVTSDIYFMEVRPYGVSYRQADERGGGAGGGGQGGGGQGDRADEQLSRRQRELIAATFNLVRDRAGYSGTEFNENVAALAQAQEKLREQALTLVQRIANRGVPRDSSFRQVAEALPRAAAEMAAAVQELRTRKPGEALPPEQRALLHLQRAEAAYREVQVSMEQQGGGGGGGGGGSASAEDLADLFGLELDKLRNQYETVQRGERQQAQGEVDQALDRVRELAHRQQRASEQMRSAMAGQLRSGNAAEEQRRLARETEEAARRLERLSRDRQRPELAETARRLRDAADAMRRAAADARGGNAGEARAALDRLDEARRRLEGTRATGTRQEAEELSRRAAGLAEEQRRIGRDMEELQGAADRAERARRLAGRKEQQAEGVADLERRLDRLSADTRQTQPDASRRLRAAAESIRRNQVEENIRDSRAGTQPGAPREYVRRAEEQIAAGLEEARRLTEEARAAVAAGPAGQRDERSLDRARELARSLESLQERTRQAGADPGRDGPPQQEGGQAAGAEQAQPGRAQQGQRPQGQGQQGGQRASRGQQGQSGGQAGQGDQAGQQGQPAQGGQPGRGARDGEGGENAGGPRGGWGARGGYAPGGWDGSRAGLEAGEIRQLRAEARQRLAEARALRRQLAAEGRDVRALDQAIADLRGLDSDGAYADWEALQHIQSRIADRVKQFEFHLRQAVHGERSRRLFLSGSGEVPEGYRELVERYYRELSDRPRR